MKLISLGWRNSHAGPFETQGAHSHREGTQNVDVPLGLEPVLLVRHLAELQHVLALLAQDEVVDRGDKPSKVETQLECAQSLVPNGLLST